jgi:hypothetical protein
MKLRYVHEQLGLLTGRNEAGWPAPFPPASSSAGSTAPLARQFGENGWKFVSER